MVLTLSVLCVWTRVGVRAARKTTVNFTGNRGLLLKFRIVMSGQAEEDDVKMSDPEGLKLT